MNKFQHPLLNYCLPIS